MLEPVNGKVRFREHMSTGPVVMEVVEARLHSLRHAHRRSRPAVRRHLDVRACARGDGTRLTITERGEVYNPIFRFLSRFVFAQTATMESFLRGLGGKFGETVSL